jgi:hypothetical protein
MALNTCYQRPKGRDHVGFYHSPHRKTDPYTYLIMSDHEFHSIRSDANRATRALDYCLPNNVFVVTERVFLIDFPMLVAYV